MQECVSVCVCVYFSFFNCLEWEVQMESSSLSALESEMRGGCSRKFLV